MKLIHNFGPLMVLLLVTSSQAGILRDLHNKHKERLATLLDPLGLFHRDDSGQIKANSESSSINHSFNLGPIGFSSSVNHASASVKADGSGGSATADANANAGENRQFGSSANANTNAFGDRQFGSGTNANANLNAFGNKQFGSDANSNAKAYSNVNANVLGGGQPGNSVYTNPNVNIVRNEQFGSDANRVINPQFGDDANGGAYNHGYSGKYPGEAENNRGHDHRDAGSYGGLHFGYDTKLNVDLPSYNNEQHYGNNPFLNNGASANANANAKIQAKLYNHGVQVGGYEGTQTRLVNSDVFTVGQNTQQPYYGRGRNVGGGQLNASANAATNANAYSHADDTTGVIRSSSGGTGGISGDSDGDHVGIYGESTGSGTRGLINEVTYRYNDRNQGIINAGDKHDRNYEGSYRGGVNFESNANARTNANANAKANVNANANVGDVQTPMIKEFPVFNYGENCEGGVTDINGDTDNIPTTIPSDIYGQPARSVNSSAGANAQINANANTQANANASVHKSVNKGFPIVDFNSYRLPQSRTPLQPVDTTGSSNAVAIANTKAGVSGSATAVTNANAGNIPSYEDSFRNYKEDDRPITFTYNKREAQGFVATAIANANVYTSGGGNSHTSTNTETRVTGNSATATAKAHAIITF